MGSERTPLRIARVWAAKARVDTKEAGSYACLFEKIMTFWSWDKRPDAPDRFRSSGRRDAPGAACGTAGTVPAEVRSGDDVPASRPGEHAKHVVLVTLPLVDSPVPPICRRYLPAYICKKYNAYARRERTRVMAVTRSVRAAPGRSSVHPSPAGSRRDPG